MLALDFFSNKTFLALAAGVGYAVATILMKLAADNTTSLVVGSIVLVLAVVVVAEVLLLRQVDLGIAYIAIMATETLLVLGATYYVGQPLSPQQLAGGMFVVAGVAMVSF
jgi:multidrug transporter EmrE-like cation transporter